MSRTKKRPAERSRLFNDKPGASLPFVAERGKVSMVQIHEHRKEDGSHLFQIEAKRFGETYPQGFFSDDLERATLEADRYLKPDLARDAKEGIEQALSLAGVSTADMPRLRRTFSFH